MYMDRKNNGQAYCMDVAVIVSIFGERIHKIHVVEYHQNSKFKAMWYIPILYDKIVIKVYMYTLYVYMYTHCVFIIAYVLLLGFRFYL